jgi:hypothetical protein
MFLELKKTSTSLKSTLFLLVMLLGTIPLSQAASSEFLAAEEITYQIDISEIKELPTITLIDKNLRVVAEFYGDPKDVKQQFANVFEQTELLVRYNDRSIYFVTN